MCRFSWNLGASASWNPQTVHGLLYVLLGKLDKRIITCGYTTGNSWLTQQSFSRTGKVECHTRWKWVYMQSTTAKSSLNLNSNIMEPVHTRHNHPAAVFPSSSILLPPLCHCAFIPARRNLACVSNMLVSQFFKLLFKNASSVKLCTLKSDCK